MKKKQFILYSILLIITCAGAYSGWKYKARQDALKGWKGYETVSYKIYNTSYELLVADTADKQEKGLMNVREMKEFDGMLFTFPTEEYQTFWNENTFRDLDIYWIRKGRVIAKDTLPSVEKGGQVIVSSPERVDTVVEIIRPL
ncbi:MAG: hypothetical protein RI947_467 [Candidatus Parcubacteria bacterium]|jgi:uncharacterized membrane protein (UPF0127 family)